MSAVAASVVPVVGLVCACGGRGVGTVFLGGVLAGLAVVCGGRISLVVVFIVDPMSASRVRRLFFSRGLFWWPLCNVFGR